MAQGNCQNFSQLYRQAFAERDPERKMVLLGQVRKAIEEWELLLQNWVASDTEMIPPARGPASSKKMEAVA